MYVCMAVFAPDYRSRFPFRIELQPLNIIIQALHTDTFARSSKDNVNNFEELFQFEANLLFNTHKLNETHQTN